MLLRSLWDSQAKRYYEQNVILFIPCTTIFTQKCSPSEVNITE